VVTRIYAWATDGGACDWYRVISPLSTLDFKYPEQYEWSAGGPVMFPPQTERQIVIGQRVAGDQPLWRELCRRDDIVTVYDLDDDLLDIDPANTIPYRIYAPIRSHTLENIQRADVVTVSTPTLAAKIREETGHTSVHVLPNCTAGHLLGPPPQVRRSDAVARIVWAGSPFHLQDWDNTGVGEALKRLHGKYGVRVQFTTMGGDYMGHLVPTNVLPLVGIGDHYLRLHGRYDIGLAPLYDHPFNDCKSWCKALEYAAAGIVPVCSPRPQYRAWTGAGTLRAGFVTFDDSAESWFEAIDSLLSADPDYRHSLAVKAWLKAAEYTIENMVHWWHRVYQEAMAS
jgi:glycosyltransferase involved in cell wall biosynthesis